MFITPIGFTFSIKKNEYIFQVIKEKILNIQCFLMVLFSILKEKGEKR